MLVMKDAAPRTVVGDNPAKEVKKMMLTSFDLANKE